MPNNHIIIGLGGTGGNIILAFRKILWQEHRNLEPRLWNEQAECWGDPLANIGYLYVDSSDKELNQSDGNWVFLGESLALDKAQKLLIRDANMEATLQNPKQAPGISGWLGDAEVIGSMIKNDRGGHGANQIRRFGRYLFAQNAKRFEDRIKELVRNLTEGSTAEVTFHVCCTLGCGTGSGSVVDAISQIRKLYPDGASHRIFLYCLITDTHVTESVGFFYPNQYAALTELNALRQGFWKPHDVLAFTEKRLEGLRDNFQSCFLIYGINEKNVNIPKKEQEDMVAGFIYQRTVALHGITPRSLHQAETFEDFKAFDALLKERCASFGSFGIKRFRIPEEEIREKLSYTFSSQAALQSLFNNWSEHGFVKAPLNRDLPELVTNPENNERWYLTDDHLKISKDFVLAGGKSWSSIPDDWKVTLENKKQSLLKFKSATRKDRETWLNEMLGFAESFFDKNFRGRGVNNYYQDKREAILDYAREIRRRIESDLFDRWKLGQDSVTDTQRITDALIKHLETRKTKLDQRASEARKEETIASQRMRETESKWQGVGLLADWLTSKPAQLLGAFTNATTDKYIAMTEIAACAFARDLVQQVIGLLTETRNSVLKVTAMFSKLAEDYEKEVKARVAYNESMDFGAKEVKLVEAKEIGQTIRALQVDQEVQKGQCAAARAEIAAALGVASEEHTFSSIAKKINSEQLGRVVFRSCDKAGATAHAALFKAPTELRRILGRNIIEKLYEDHGGVSEALKQNIQNLVQSSAAYMSFDRMQTQPSVIHKKDMPNMPRRAIVVFMPKAKDLEEFRQKLKETFSGAFEEEVQVVDTDNNPNEILLVNVCFWYELRFMRPLVNLRAKYIDFVKSNQRETIHQIHLENHRAIIKELLPAAGISLLPQLEYQGADVGDFLNYVLLGMAIGFILPEENERGITVLQYARRKASGMALSDIIDLGSLDPTEASKRMSLTVFEGIKADLDQELKHSCQHVDQKRSLIAKLDALAEAKFVERGKRNDPAFQTFRKKVDEVTNIINQA